VPATALTAVKGSVNINKGMTTSHVKIDIGGGTIVTASITNAAPASQRVASLAHCQGGSTRWS
jgi:molybdopterin-binding protein